MLELQGSPNQFHTGCTSFPVPTKSVTPPASMTSVTSTGFRLLKYYVIKTPLQ